MHTVSAVLVQGKWRFSGGKGRLMVNGEEVGSIQRGDPVRWTFKNPAAKNNKTIGYTGSLEKAVQLVEMAASVGLVRPISDEPGDQDHRWNLEMYESR